jgi:hypothetical protein
MRPALLHTSSFCNCLGLGKLDNRASLLEGWKKEKRRRSRRFSFFHPVLSRFSVVEPAETRTSKQLPHFFIK